MYIGHRWICDKCIAHAYRDSPTIYPASLAQAHFCTSVCVVRCRYFPQRFATAPMSCTFFFMLYWYRFVLRQPEINIWRSWKLRRRQPIVTRIRWLGKWTSNALLSLYIIAVIGVVTNARCCWAPIRMLGAVQEHSSQSSRTTNYLSNK